MVLTAHSDRAMKIQLTVILALVLAAGLSARPVPFTGAWSFMAEHDEEGEQFVANQAINRNWAPGILTKRTRTDEGSVYSMTADLNHLLYRRNAASYQANVFVTGGVGHFDGPGGSNIGTRFSIQADAEDRRRYIAARFHYFHSSGVLHRQKWIGRVGWAPYEAGFQDLNTWLIVQAEYETRHKQELVIRPIVRLFYRNVLAEIGSSLDGDLFTSLTLQHRF